MIPTSRATFKEWCLRALGKPVLNINVDDDQIEDRIDYALQTFWDYHFDGSDKEYYRYIIQSKDIPGHLSEIDVANSGTGYDNTDIVVITPDSSTNSGANGEASIVTDDNGAILRVTVEETGGSYMNPPIATVTSANGSGAVLTAYNGGYIKLPENIIGAVNIFEIAASIYGGSANMFNIQYQIALNDLYNITTVSMVPYFLARMHIAEIGQWFVGEQPLRYNRHMNRVYLDMDWIRVGMGGTLVVEAYKIVDPDVYKDAWNDRWLKLYCTAQIKMIWGNNLKKYGGMPLPGNVLFNGQKIYDEAIQEIKELEQRMIIDYGYPVTDMIG